MLMQLLFKKKNTIKLTSKKVNYTEDKHIKILYSNKKCIT